MGGKEKEGRVGGRGKGKGGEGKGERMWRGPESGLPRGPCWLSAGLLKRHTMQLMALVGWSRWTDRVAAWYKHRDTNIKFLEAIP